MDEAQFKKWRTILADELTWAYVHLHALEQMSLTPDNVRVMNGYHVFFGSTRAAHAHALLLRIAKATDRTKGTVNFASFIARASENQAWLFGAPIDLTRISARFNALDETIQKVRTYRNKRLVHLDPHHLDVNTVPSVPLKEVLTLLSELGNLLNEMSAAHDATGLWYEVTPPMDAKQLLTDLSSRSDDEL